MTWRRRLILLACLSAFAGMAFAGYAWWTRPRPTPPTEIFRGVVYTCEQTDAEECRGLVHIVKVDLAAPGIGLYLTPTDPEAVKQGYQYRLTDAATVLRREGLAVVVNGGYFSADSELYYSSDDLARGAQTIVADGQISHIDAKSYMLWFEPDLTPHIEPTYPPSEALLRKVRWAIGSWWLPLWKGQIRPGMAGHKMDRCTAVGIDSRRRLLWLAVFENASSLAVARVLAQHGAEDGFLLDGGHSTNMVLGPKAAQVRSGSLLGGWRPVATCFGIKAQSL